MIAKLRRLFSCCTTSPTPNHNRKKRAPLSKTAHNHHQGHHLFNQDHQSSPQSSSASPTPTITCNPVLHPPKPTVTGTIFGQRRAHACFCIQQDIFHHPSKSPLLLELSTPTSLLAKEMDSGLLRISLKCDRSDRHLASCSLRSVPLWSMYCNGRKVGFAIRRRASEKDREVLKAVQATSAGAGIVPPASAGEEEVMFMRGSYQRVVGSRDSEAFHLIDPSGSPSQELSVFLLRAG
ncbi:hypothetical protein ACLOJK_030125 [Asimina triloba]